MKRPTLSGRARLKGVYYAARHLPDRVLHRRRYLAACQRLSVLGRPRAILVICYGNICRSPYFAALLERALPDVNVGSAGLVGPSGRRVPGFSLAASEERGVDLSAFRSRTIAPAHVRRADLFVVMEKGHAAFLTVRFGVPPQRIVIAGDLDPAPSATRGIVDPWQQSIEVFRSSFDRLDRCAKTLVSLLQSPPTTKPIPE